MTDFLNTPSEVLQKPEQHQELRAERETTIGHLAIEKAVQPKNLESLRFGVRGNDEAVHEIGTEADQQVLLNVLKNPDRHTRDELLESTCANYSGETYGDKQWVKKHGAWGDSPETVTAYGQLIESHPEWAQLSLDPGFMTHLPEFMNMLDGGEITATDYEGARQQLKDKLGYKTVWRGTMLTDAEYAKVQTEGLGSPLSKIVRDSVRPQEQFEATALSAWPSHTIEAHFHGEHKGTPFLSVSEHADVAISVGRHFGDKSPGKRLYLFKLNIPTIDLVSYKEHAYSTPYRLKQMQNNNPDIAIKVGVNGENTSYKWDESVESFVYWKIDAAEIIEVSQPEVKESSWNGRVTGMPNT